ncbi:unnamed protein product [Eruca vesicaria subsp. sativa]|uniref:Glucosamine-phosphate N-acetyltransferase n=1 Tax=Eruca vesicaria subsp. sativa TaxID=29727 RepID=A0ABC8LY52_ERUVS|nr:unnamed protein product [Eruca vesicaria subsp. sativa]
MGFVVCVGNASLVSVFCKPHHVEESTSDRDDDDAKEERLSSSSLYPLESRRQSKEESSLGDMFQDVLPFSPSSGQLVGFGRAYSDYSHK